ncbi:MAG: transposase [Limnochordia bacterium]|nr:transposase [Limnochordia bacterium]
MPRKPRHWYPGATYHITCRGNHRQDIFKDAKDRQVYLAQLLQAKEDHSCTILSYCLMTNHVHLQVETSHVELWHMMKQLNQRYVLYFNRKYDLVGRLFQGRYRAELIKDLAGGLAVSRYIHLNPVVAAMVKTPSAYPWSSYRNFMGLRFDSLVWPERILDHFPQPRQKQYRTYVEQVLENEGLQE